MWERSYTRAVTKVMNPILVCWPTMSEAHVGGMAVKVEHSHQHSVTFCWCVTDSSNGTLWQSCVAWSKGVGLNSFMQKTWHLLVFISACECWWRPNSGCQHSEVVGGASQQWWQRCERHQRYRRPCRSVRVQRADSWFIAGENAQLMAVAMLKNSIW